jgi:hypothetical protein
VEEPVENGGGEHVVAAILTRFNWNWLKLVQAESACGLGNGVFGVPPTFRADGGLCEVSTLIFSCEEGGGGSSWMDGDHQSYGRSAPKRDPEPAASPDGAGRPAAGRLVQPACVAAGLRHPQLGARC